MRKPHCHELLLGLAGICLTLYLIDGFNNQLYAQPIQITSEEWQIEIISVNKAPNIIHQQLLGAKHDSNMIYSGGKLTNKTLKSEKGTFLFITIKAVNIKGGKDFPGAKFVLSDRGNEYPQSGYFAKKEDKYYVSMLALSLKGDTIEYYPYFDIPLNTKEIQLKIPKVSHLLTIPLSR